MNQVYISDYQIICSSGGNVESFWAKLKNGICHFSYLDGSLISNISDFVAPRIHREHDRVTQLAAACASQLIQSIHFDKCAATIFASSRGATSALENYHGNFLNKKKLPPFASPVTTAGSLATTVAESLALQGPTMAVSAACTSGMSALLTSYAFISSGISQQVLLGAAESCLTPFCLSMFRAARIYHPIEPAQDLPYRPFSEHRKGMVVGEGAATLKLDANLENGIRIAGIAATHESSGMTSLSSDAMALQQACHQAFAMAGISPGEISFVVAHGGGTIRGDAAEKASYKAIFRDEIPPITSCKWNTGHLLGAANAASLIFACEMLRRREYIPHPYPTIFANDQQRPQHFRYALVTSLGFGGNAAAAVLKI